MSEDNLKKIKQGDFVSFDFGNIYRCVTWLGHSNIKYYGDFGVEGKSKLSHVTSALIKENDNTFKEVK